MGLCALGSLPVWCSPHPEFWRVFFLLETDEVAKAPLDAPHHHNPYLGRSAWVQNKGSLAVVPLGTHDLRYFLPGVR